HHPRAARASPAPGGVARRGPRPLRPDDPDGAGPDHAGGQGARLRAGQVRHARPRARVGPPEPRRRRPPARVSADATVLLIGVVAAGGRLAPRLGPRGTGGRSVLAARSRVDDAPLPTRLPTGCRGAAVQLDATRLDDVAELLGRLRPDLVVQAAS